MGLRPGEAALVFNRFWRADPARARTTGGTGLGLAIALEDARLHGGWLEAWGEPGIGACFRLTLRGLGDVYKRQAVLPLSDEATDDEESSDATGDESGSSLEHSPDRLRGSTPSDPSSADSLVFTVPPEGEGGSRR